jgi:hypothetical protein
MAAVAIGIYAETDVKNQASNDPVSLSVAKGLKWLVAVQGRDGGWGQDGGETSYVRQGEHLESSGNDVANTAVAALALLHAGSTPVSGEYRQPLQRAVDFILRQVEQSPVDGLAVTSLHGTQIERKLGPYIDTFLTSKLLAELDRNMGDAQANARVRKSLEKCVAKIQKGQLKDGSWNIAGGWAPILGTSLASQSLDVASQKGVAVPGEALEKVQVYTANSAGRSSDEARASAAGVNLYKDAQELEQISRTEGDRKKNAGRMREIQSNLSDTRYVTGFGSIGGEEFFSYLNVSDSLRRTGGAEWKKWNGDMTNKILQMQNADGTWAGHHCITGRVAVTSAAILIMTADRQPGILTTSAHR